MRLFSTPNTHKQTPWAIFNAKISSQIHHTGRQKRDFTVTTHAVSLSLWFSCNWIFFLMYTNIHLSSTRAHMGTHTHTHTRLATLLYPWVRITLWGSISPGWTIYPLHLMLNPIQYKQLYPFFPALQTCNVIFIWSSYKHTHAHNVQNAPKISSAECSWIIHMRKIYNKPSLQAETNVLFSRVQELWDRS